MPQIPALNSADGEGAQGTGAAQTTECSTDGRSACSGGPLGLLPAPKPWDVKTSPQMTSFILSDQHLPAPAGPALCCQGDVMASSYGLCGSADTRAYVQCVRSGYVSVAVALALPPVSPVLGSRKREAGRELMSPPRRKTLPRKRRWHPRWLLTPLPEAARSILEASPGRKPAGPRDVLLTEAEPSADSGFPPPGPAEAPPPLGPRETLPAEKNNLCEAPGYIRDPPTSGPLKQRSCGPRWAGRGHLGQGPGASEHTLRRNRSSMRCLRRYSENLN